MINTFGEYGGFDKFRDRILTGEGLNVSIIAAMIRWVVLLCITIYVNARVFLFYDKYTVFFTAFFKNLIFIY